MGILGPQLVVTMIVASFVHKLTPYYSFGRWFSVRRLKRHLSPTDEDLRPHVIRGGEGGAKGNRNSLGAGGRVLESCLLKKIGKLELTAVPLTDRDLSNVTFHTELKWALDLLVAVVVVFGATLVYYWFVPSARRREMNVCLSWIVILFCYVTRSLVSVTKVYIAHLQERWICLLMALFFLVCSLTVLLMDEELLEFGLEDSHRQLAKALKKVAGMGDPHISPLFPLWVLKVGMALVSTALGSHFIFPSMSYSRMQYDLISDRNLSVFTHTLLQCSYFFPIVCTSLWIKPTARLEFTSNNRFSNEGFDLFRITVLVCYCLLRFILYHKYLQVHLDRAKKCISVLPENKTTVSELRSQIANPFTLFSCVALQYIGPIILLFLCSLLLFFSSHCCNLFGTSVTEGEEQVSMVHIPLFDLTLYRGVFSFLCWWMCFVIFIAGLLGSVLEHYLYI